MSFLLEEDVPRIKDHIQSRLAPICEADPNVLSDYIIALLHHDMDLANLKGFCKEQLEDFLREYTESFVDNLFSVLQQRSYAGATVPKADVRTAEVPPESDRRRVSPSQPDARPAERSARNGDRRPCFEHRDKGWCSRGPACQYEHDGPRRSFRSDTRRRERSRSPDRRRTVRRDEPSEFRGNFGIRVPPHPTIIVDNVPADRCNPADITRVFARFGDIAEVRAAPHERRAMVKFASVEQAIAAHDCPNPIFDNRFIKVFYFRPGLEPPEHFEHTQPGFYPMEMFPPADPSMMPAFGFHPAPSNILAEAIRKKAQIMETLVDMRHKISLKLADQLSDSSRQAYLATLEKLEKQIQNLESSQIGVSSESSLKQKAEERQKAILDRELDIIQTQISRGAERQEVVMAEGSQQRPKEHYSYNGQFSMRYLGAERLDDSRFNLDLRPTTIHVSGFSNDQKAEVLKHFRNFGEVAEINGVENAEDAMAQNTSDLSIKYRTRQQAEKAMSFGAKGRAAEFGQNLVVCWKN